MLSTRLAARHRLGLLAGAKARLIHADWLTGVGYALSIVSVAPLALLAWVAWPAPGEDRALAMAVIAGGALSVIGMAMRWAAHLIMHRKIEEDD